MAKSEPNPDAVSSPTATGGGGTTFEQDVVARALALLLVGAVPPCLTDCVLVEIAVQTEHLKWNTDDLLLVGKAANGRRRHFANQVKRSFEVSKSNDECVKAFNDLWRDFQNPAVFAEGRDLLGFVFLGGNVPAAPRLMALCDCARASKDAKDFRHRLQTEGLLSKPVRKDASTIEDILKASGIGAFSDDVFWRFLKSIHLQSTDVSSSAGHDESLLKTMLAMTATGLNKLDEANLTLHELVDLARKGMPKAATVTRDTLPAPMRARHGLLGESASGILSRLRDHSDTSLKRIRTTFGKKVSLAREAVVGNLLETMATSPVILVSGTAGAGKSVVAKLATDKLRPALLVWVFKAEEFRVAHLDKALLDAQIPATAEQLRGMLAGQDRKVLLIESVERLLEATCREAFIDLLTMCVSDPSWQVVLTCRDYSVEIVRSSLLAPFGIASHVFEVPPLSDEEISEVLAGVPGLSRASSHKGLRSLFRTPYLLDKAVQMDWPESGSLPEDERAFRKKFWADVVRHEADATPGLPARRQSVFIEVCLRRAKALEPFASSEGLDQEALDRLYQDGLIDFEDDHRQRAAPAHDVLEDWAVVEWIGAKHASLSNDTVAFAAELGPYPAIRRGFRKWLSELLSSDESATGKLVTGVVNTSNVPAYFRDDVLVAVLRSEYAKQFLERNRPLLVADDCFLLRKVIHLLRVACKVAHPLSKGLKGFWSVPIGAAWAAVIKFVRSELNQLLPKDLALVSGLIEDWALSVAWWNPNPAGFEDVAAIAFGLFPHVDGYRHKEVRKRILKVIAKCPAGSPEEFKKLMDRAISEDDSDDIPEDFAEVALCGMDGTFVCRECPDDVIRLAEVYYVEPPVKPGGFIQHYHSDRVPLAFGVRPHLRPEFEMASAYLGPFLGLMRYHRQKAIDFIIRLVNRSAENYGSPKIPHRLEPASKVTLKLADATLKEYWSNGRLWVMYRGFSVAPYVLQSALMALEAYLLEQCEEETSFNCEAWLNYLLSQSNNVALVGVVASVAMAYPQAAGTASLAVLSSLELIELDKSRFVHERTNVFNLLPVIGRHRIFNDERTKSNALPHRKSELERLIVQLQVGPLRKAIHSQLDEWYAKLPPVDEQTDEHRLIRLALRRMDLRGFEARQVSPDEFEKMAGPEHKKPEGPMTIFQPTKIEPDLQAMIDKELPWLDRTTLISSMTVWGDKILRGDEESDEGWREKLRQAQETAKLLKENAAVEPMSLKAVLLITAACAKNRWPEMTVEEQEFCLQIIGASVVESLNVDGGIGLMIEPAMRHLAGLLVRDVPDQTRQNIEVLVALALTHTDKHVAAAVTTGVGVYLGKDKPEACDGFIGFCARRAKRLAELEKSEDALPYNQRRGHDEIRDVVLKPLFEEKGWLSPCSPEEIEDIDAAAWFGREGLKRIAGICVNRPVDALSKKLALILAKCLKAEWQRRDDDDDDRRSRDYYFEGDCETLVANVACRLSLTDALEVLAPILDCVEHHPDEVAGFVKSLVVAGDRPDRFGTFWALWQEFAKRVKEATWVNRLDERSSSHSKDLIGTMFFRLEWNNGVTHWSGLDGHSDDVEQFFRSLPPVPAAFAAFSYFLYRIGEKSLPGAFPALADKMREGKAANILADSETVYCLETLLRQYVYGRADAVKAEKALRDAVLYLLDQLIEGGSSNAYMMRDYFVTPGQYVSGR